MQTALQAKRKKLQHLEQGASSVLQAAAPPCTDLRVSEVQPQRSAHSAAAAEQLAQLPQPLSVLASELQLVQPLYGMPIQVRRFWWSLLAPCSA